jgi:hypothetical protein
MTKAAKITLSAKFPMGKDEVLGKPKQISIAVNPGAPGLLDNDVNTAWIENVIERFRTGPGKEEKSG